MNKKKLLRHLKNQTKNRCGNLSGDERIRCMKKLLNDNEEKYVKNKKFYNQFQENTIDKYLKDIQEGYKMNAAANLAGRAVNVIAKPGVWAAKNLAKVAYKGSKAGGRAAKNTLANAVKNKYKSFKRNRAMKKRLGKNYKSIKKPSLAGSIIKGLRGRS